MSWFSRLERISEKFIEGIFKTKFAGPLQPVELASALAKEMGEHRRISVTHTYVPNHFDVLVSKKDWEQLEPVQESIKEEVRQYLKMKAREKKFVLVQEPELNFIPQETVSSGGFEISSKFSDYQGKPETEHTQVFSLGRPIAREEESVPTPRAELVIKSGESKGMKIRLGKGVSNLGRRESNEVFLDDPNISRVHAQIELFEGKYILTDLGSLNGTYLNGKRIHRTHLSQGDHIKLGKTELDFRVV